MSFFNAAVFEDYLVQENNNAAPTTPLPDPPQEQPRDYQIHVTARPVDKDATDHVKASARRNTSRVKDAA